MLHYTFDALRRYDTATRNLEELFRIEHLSYHIERSIKDIPTSSRGNHIIAFLF